MIAVERPPFCKIAVNSGSIAFVFGFYHGTHGIRTHSPNATHVEKIHHAHGVYRMSQVCPPASSVGALNSGHDETRPHSRSSPMPLSITSPVRTHSRPENP